jgi:hypothetical protein
VPPYRYNGGVGSGSSRNPNGPNGPNGPTNNNGGNGPSGGVFPYDEYATLPIHRILTYSQPVEPYTGKKLYNLEISTILKFTFEFSDYVV